jgi:hypothetical protein
MPTLLRRPDVLEFSRQPMARVLRILNWTAIPPLPQNPPITGPYICLVVVLNVEALADLSNINVVAGQSLRLLLVYILRFRKAAQKTDAGDEHAARAPQSCPKS